MKSRKELLSGFAKRLLARAPRESAVEPPPPMDEPMNNFFIEEFAEKCSNEFIRPSSSDRKLSDEEEGSHSDSDSDGTDSGPSKELLMHERQMKTESDIEKRKRVVTLKNIPFNATEDDIVDFCRDFEVTNVELPTLGSSARSAGFALVTFMSSSEAENAAQFLDNNKMDGRRIMTRQHLVDNFGEQRRRLQDNSRYYVPSSEALQLGATHGMKVKNHPKSHYKPRNPCFLCAREGHTAGDCPYQVCFRCQHSGHLARHCQPKNYGRLEFCTMCGAANKHNTNDCEVLTKNIKIKAKKKLDSSLNSSVHEECLKDIECLNCREAKCTCDKDQDTSSEMSSQEKVDVGRLYCYLCGDSGHISPDCRFHVFSSSSSGKGSGKGKGGAGKGGDRYEGGSYGGGQGYDQGYGTHQAKRSRHTGSFSGGKGAQYSCDFDDDDDDYYNDDLFSGASLRDKDDQARFRSGRNSSKGGKGGGDRYNHFNSQAPVHVMNQTHARGGGPCYICGQYGHVAAACGNSSGGGKGRGRGKGYKGGGGSYGKGRGGYR